jgi:hypothetical protein
MVTCTIPVYLCFLARTDISFLKLKHTGHYQHKIPFTQLSNVIVEGREQNTAIAALPSCGKNQQ